MAEPISIQQLKDASLDVKSLEEVVNGDENVVVTTRLGETYPSVKGSIKELFENGGLPATPFKTKALMTASSLVDGDYAMVTDDTDNNGLYVKTAGAWVKSDYDPLTQAKSYTDTAKTEATNSAYNYTDNILKENSAEVNYDNSAFNIQYPYNASGTEVIGAFWQNWRRTDKIPVSAGDTIEVNAVGDRVEIPWLVLFNESNEFTGVRVFGKVSTSTQTGLHTVEEDGFIVAQASNQGLNSSMIINKNRKLFASAEIEPLVTSKADELKKLYFTDFESGGVGASGVEGVKPFEARSVLTYKLKAGTKVTFVNKQQWASGQPRYQFGFGVRSADDTRSPYPVYYREASWTHTITADEPYIRFFLRDDSSVGTELNIEEALSYISIYVEQPVLRENVFENGEASSDGIGLSAIPKSSSAYRPSSMATGGVITIIDDDGKALVASELYQYFKNLDVPFGIAVHGGEVDNPLYLSKEQLDTLYADKKYVEILSHGFKHRNLTSVTPEIAEATVRDNKEWFNRNGYDVDAFVLPNGGDNEFARAMVARYYNSCYDYGAGARVETFDTINNHLIKRTAFVSDGDTVAYHKTKIDEAVASNGWLVITTHVGLPNYWGTYAQLTEIIEYAKSKGMKFKLPREGFQIFGNIAENDSGFRIQANGKIVGAS